MVAVAVAAALAGSLGTGVVLTHAAKPPAKSVFVYGKLVDRTATEGCPTDYCNEGTYLTGKIRGDFQFVLRKLIPSETPGVVFYEGEGVVHTPQGDLRCEDFGAWNTAEGTKGEGVQLCEITGGTGIYKGATGYIQDRFFFTGGKGFADYKGMIRFAKR